MDTRASGLVLGGIQKLTLLDYPGKVACTVFTAGCNMRCPFCHNRDLVFVPDDLVPVDPDEVLELLEKRKGVLDGLAVTGGEPLMHAGLPDFLKKVKDIGYLVKLDTNGMFPERLEAVIDAGLVDYVAMDLKNSPELYAVTCGLPEGTEIMPKIRKSIEILRSGKVEHEFRTTVVRQLHTAESLMRAAEEIRGEENYFLQQFEDSGHCIEEGFTAYSAAEMRELEASVRTIIPTARLRGIKEEKKDV